MCSASLLHQSYVTEAGWRARSTGCGASLQMWVEEMAPYLKAIDPNHLVTLGAEGFYSTTCERVFLNPGAGHRRTGIASSPWASQEGQDFLANHVVPSIDLVTTHIWADNWMGYADWSGSTINDGFDYTHGRNLWQEKLDYTNNWLAAHISDAQARPPPARQPPEPAACMHAYPPLT